MLPTQFRAKLGRTLSYPIGAEAISRALEGVPQSSLPIWFGDKPTTFASEFRRLLMKGQPYVVLRSSFIKWDKRLSMSDDPIVQEYYRGIWRIHVYPVPRDAKPVAKVQILAVGLPAIRQWLCAPRPPSWHYGRKRCDVLFVPDEGIVKIAEVVEAA